MKKKIILASASPRRRELLARIGLEFEVIPGKGEEKITKEIPCEIVMELAEGKAEEIFNKLQFESKQNDVQAELLKEHWRETSPMEKLLVIGADTIVVHNGHIMGKPIDEADAEAMLTELCGDTHQVYTGVAFFWMDKGAVCKHTFYECTDVFVYPASREEIRAYVETKDPMDKAGAYGIQGQFAAFIQKIEGDYNNVVGLPVGRVYQELKTNGFV